MNLFTFIFTLVIFSFVFLSIYTFAIDPHSKPNRVFSILYFLVFLWLLSYMLFAPAGVKSSFTALHQYFTCVFLFISGLSVHFAVVLTKNKKLDNWRLFLFLYLPGIYFAVSGLTGLFGWNERQWLGDMWALAGVSGFPLFQLYCSFCLVYLAAHLLILGLWRRKARGREKKRAGFYIWGSGIFYCGIGIIDLFTPVFKNELFPILHIILMIIISWFIWFIMFKYKFMEATPSIAAGEILDNIEELVVLLDTDYSIITVNRKFLSFLPYKMEDIKNRNFFEFTGGDNSLHEQLQLVRGGKADKIQFRIFYKKDADLILTDSYISGIRDKSGDLIGILVISRENRGRKQMQAVYKITGREFEIIELSIAGFSNHDMAERLGIALKTVEAHIVNIYNKIGIKNRIELMNIANDFNLLPKKGEAPVFGPDSR